MNKAPAFQFYVGDYLQDTRCLSLAARGAWVDCLCAMWRSSTRGVITYPLVGFARLFGCTVDQAKAVIDELVEMQICDVATADDAKVTMTNRRMKREAEERNRANDRQLRYKDRQRLKNDANGDGKDDEKVTPYSSSSPSTSPSNKPSTTRENMPTEPPQAEEFSREPSEESPPTQPAPAPPTVEAKRAEKEAIAASVREVFSYWQLRMGHPDAKLLDKRRKVIEARLREGYTVDRIKRAIDGCRASAWHMGIDPRSNGTVYDSIELICRDGEKIESFEAKLNGTSSNGGANGAGKTPRIGDGNRGADFEAVAERINARKVF